MDVQIKRPQEELVDNYKARSVAQDFRQISGAHYVFASTLRFAPVRMATAPAAGEDLELESMDILTASLNGAIDSGVYMRAPDSLGVEGEPRDSEGAKGWWYRYRSIKQRSHLRALQLHSVL